MAFTTKPAFAQAVLRLETLEGRSVPNASGLVQSFLPALLPMASVVAPTSLTVSPGSTTSTTTVVLQSSSAAPLPGPQLPDQAAPWSAVAVTPADTGSIAVGVFQSYIPVPGPLPPSAPSPQEMGSVESPAAPVASPPAGPATTDPSAPTAGQGTQQAQQPAWGSVTGASATPAPSPATTSAPSGQSAPATAPASSPAPAAPPASSLPAPASPPSLTVPRSDPSLAVAAAPATSPAVSGPAVPPASPAPVSSGPFGYPDSSTSSTPSGTPARNDAPWSNPLSPELAASAAKATEGTSGDASGTSSKQGQSLSPRGAKLQGDDQAVSVSRPASNQASCTSDQAGSTSTNLATDPTASLSPKQGDKGTESSGSGRGKSAQSQSSSHESDTPVLRALLASSTDRLPTALEKLSFLLGQYDLGPLFPLGDHRLGLHPPSSVLGYLAGTAPNGVGNGSTGYIPDVRRPVRDYLKSVGGLVPDQSELPPTEADPTTLQQALRLDPFSLGLIPRMTSLDPGALEEKLKQLLEEVESLGGQLSDNLAGSNALTYWLLGAAVASVTCELIRRQVRESHRAPEAPFNPDDPSTWLFLAGVDRASEEWS